MSTGRAAKATSAASSSGGGQQRQPSPPYSEVVRRNRFQPKRQTKLEEVFVPSKRERYVGRDPATGKGWTCPTCGSKDNVWVDCSDCISHTSPKVHLPTWCEHNKIALGEHVTADRRLCKT